MNLSFDWIPESSSGMTRHKFWTVLIKMNTQQRITEILKEKFNPETLEVINESYKHAGHSGDNGSGESHFKIIISAKNVTGNSKIDKHRAIQGVLSDVAKDIHALGIELRS
jgi:BolA family transcriptional regulator, general stress-responsive regulator